MTTSISILIIAWWPGFAPWLWSSTLGIALSGTFALALALPVLETDSPQEAAGLTSMMLSVGYCIGGVAPSLVGVGRDLSADCTAPFSALAGMSLAMVFLSMLLPPPRSHGPAP